jgi:hypothetical protein
MRMVSACFGRQLDSKWLGCFDFGMRTRRGDFPIARFCEFGGSETAAPW